MFFQMAQDKLLVPGDVQLGEKQKKCEEVVALKVGMQW